MPKRFNLKGNESLIIFKKYLKYINISVYSFFSELIESLIEKNRDIFINRVEKGEIEIPPDSRLRMLYDNLKSQYVATKLEEIPDYDTLSKEELEKMMKKLSESKE